MNDIIDLESEILVDRTHVRDPYVRLVLRALGRELVRGSAWVIVDREIATYFGLDRQVPHAKAAAA